MKVITFDIIGPLRVLTQYPDTPGEVEGANSSAKPLRGGRSPLFHALGNKVHIEWPRKTRIAKVARQLLTIRQTITTLILPVNTSFASSSPLSFVHNTDTSQSLGAAKSVASTHLYRSFIYDCHNGLFNAFNPWHKSSFWEKSARKLAYSDYLIVFIDSFLYTCSCTIEIRHSELISLVYGIDIVWNIAPQRHLSFKRWPKVHHWDHLFVSLRPVCFS